MTEYFNFVKFLAITSKTKKKFIKIDVNIIGQDTSTRNIFAIIFITVKQDFIQ